MPSAQLGTPETYLNPERAQGFAQPLGAGRPHLPGRELRRPRPERVRAQGDVRHVSSESVDAGLDRGVDPGRRPGRPRLPGDDLRRTTSPRTGRVLLDGRPIPAGGRQRTSTTARYRQRPAAVLAGLAPRAEQATVTVAAPARRQRLRLHVRLAPPRRVEHRRRAKQVVGRVDVEQRVRSSTSTSARADRGDRLAQRTVRSARGRSAAAASVGLIAAEQRLHRAVAWPRRPPARRRCRRRRAARSARA